MKLIIKKGNRRRPVVVEYNGEVVRYESLTDFCKENEVYYNTALNWVHGKTKPSVNNLKIYYEEEK